MAYGQDSTHCLPMVNNPFHGPFVKQCTRMQEDMGLQYMLTAQLNAIALREEYGDAVVACAREICRDIHLCCVKQFHCGVPSLY